MHAVCGISQYIHRLSQYARIIVITEAKSLSLPAPEQLYLLQESLLELDWRSCLALAGAAPTHVKRGEPHYKL